MWLKPLWRKKVVFLRSLTFLENCDDLTQKRYYVLFVGKGSKEGIELVRNSLVIHWNMKSIMCLASSPFKGYFTRHSANLEC